MCWNFFANALCEVFHTQPSLVLEYLEREVRWENEWWVHKIKMGGPRNFACILQNHGNMIISHLFKFIFTFLNFSPRWNTATMSSSPPKVILSLNFRSYQLLAFLKLYITYIRKFYKILFPLSKKKDSFSHENGFSQIWSAYQKLKYLFYYVVPFCLVYWYD